MLASLDVPTTDLAGNGEGYNVIENMVVITDEM